MNWEKIEPKQENKLWDKIGGLYWLTFGVFLCAGLVCTIYIILRLILKSR